MQDTFLLAIPLVLFAALGVALMLVLRRAARLVAQTREMDGFRLASGDLAIRIAASLAGAAERIDAVRRGQVAADTILEALDAARDAMERYRGETRTLQTPAGYEQLRARLAEEVERAVRALDMVGHGCATLSAASIGRARAAEGQTAVKRGYLNILHAREAVLEIATNLQSTRPSRTAPRWFSGRSTD